MPVRDLIINERVLFFLLLYPYIDFSVLCDLTAFN